MKDQNVQWAYHGPEFVITNMCATRVTRVLPNDMVMKETSESLIHLVHLNVRMCENVEC